MHGGSTPQVKRKAQQRLRDLLADAIDPDRVLREVGRLAYSDVTELFDDHGRLLPVKMWPEDARRAVAGVEVVKRNADPGDGVTEDVIKVKLWDKTRNLEFLGKHNGLLTEKVELEIKGALVDRIRAGRERVASARRSLPDAR